MRISPRDDVHQLFILFDRKLHYFIDIHDHNYFVPNINSDEITSLKIKLNPESSNYYYRLTLTEVKELHHPEDPCNEDLGYNFKVCVKESISSLVGCRLP